MAANTTYPEVPEDFKLYFYTLGDVNEDGVIDQADLNLMQTARLKQDLLFDINGDGKVDMRDIAILLHNFGKDITTEWHNTIDKQRLEEAAATPETAVVPWFIEWARELAKLQAANDQAYANWQMPAMQSFMDNLKALSSLPDDIWKGHIDNADDILNAQIAASLKITHSAISNAISETPNQDYLDTMFGINEVSKKSFGQITEVMGQLPQSRYEENVNAVKFLLDLQNNMKNASVALLAGNFAMDIMAGTNLGVINKAAENAVSIYGLDQLKSLATLLPIQAAVIEPAKQYWNSTYFPFLPNVSDLVRMYASGKITIDEYSETMAMNGYDPYWQAKYWEAHWTKPTVADALTCWRRGKLTDEELNAVMRNADLDPAWQAVWEQRKFNDLGMGEAHMLWDIGLIDDAKLLDTARRSGYTLEDAAAVIDGVKQFPIRRLKLRVLLALANGAAAGTLDHTHLVAGVAKLGYDQKLVDWLVLYGNLRQEMTANTVKKTRTKLLDTADLKRAFVRGLITEDAVRTELQVRGYDLADVQLLIELLNQDRVVEEEGGKTKGLTVSELLNSWRYGVISEDILRTRLLLRGLALDDLEILIKLKKLQWSMTPTAETAASAAASGTARGPTGEMPM